MMMKNIFIIVFLCSVMISQSMASCPENLCDCDWSTPAISTPVGDFGSVTISVCDVLPQAVEDLYHNQIIGFKDDITNGAQQLADLADEKVLKQFELDNIRNKLRGLQDELGFDKIANFFSKNGELLDTVDKVVDALDSAKDGVILGLTLPTNLVKMFPELLNNIKPGSVSDAIRAQGEKVINWFTEAMFDVADVITDDSNPCNCLGKALNDGTISIDIGVDTGPGLTVTFIFRTTDSVECFITSLAQIALKLTNLVSDDLEKAWTAAETGLLSSANALVVASKAVSQSKFCNIDYDIPEVNIGDVGFDLIDDFTNEVEKFVNLVGADGPFAAVMQTISDGICDAASSEGFENFATSLQEFLDIVSFTGIKDKVIKGLFNVLHRMGNNLNEFDNANFDVNVNTCNANNRGCALAKKYGQEYVKCIHQTLKGQQLSINMGISFGEHWAPPSVTGYAGSVTCTTLDCLNCVYGLENGKPKIADTLAFITHEVFGLTNNDNKYSTTLSCSNEKDCGANGSWDNIACACRCNDGFLSGEAGCIACPSLNGEMCNGQGTCYLDGTTAKCCCVSGSGANCS